MDGLWLDVTYLPSSTIVPSGRINFRIRASLWRYSGTVGRDMAEASDDVVSNLISWHWDRFTEALSCCDPTPMIALAGYEPEIVHVITSILKEDALFGRIVDALSIQNEETYQIITGRKIGSSPGTFVVDGRTLELSPAERAEWVLKYDEKARNEYMRTLGQLRENETAVDTASQFNRQAE